MVERNKLTRSVDDRLVAGVCGGLAEYFGWTATRVRIVYVVVSALSAAFPGIAVYVILWLVMPSARRGPREFRVEGGGNGGGSAAGG